MWSPARFSARRAGCVARRRGMALPPVPGTTPDVEAIPRRQHQVRGAHRPGMASPSMTVTDTPVEGSAAPPSTVQGTARTPRLRLESPQQQCGPPHHGRRGSDPGPHSGAGGVRDVCGCDLGTGDPAEHERTGGERCGDPVARRCPPGRPHRHHAGPGNQCVAVRLRVRDAPSIAGAIGAPESTAVIRVLAVGVLIDGISSIPGALMTRAFHQRRRAVADLVALVPSSVVSIVLATQGHGAMSLAYGSLAGNLTATALVLVLAPARPLPGWHRDDAVALLRVGLPLAGTSLVLLATMNVDYVVVGRQLGTTALGLYLLAFNLSSWPSNLLSTPAVLYVDPPISHLTRFNSPVVAGSISWPRLDHRSTARPLHAARRTQADAPGNGSHDRDAGWRQLRSVVATLGADVTAVISTWLHLDVFGCLGERSRIYWWQDDPAGAGGVLGDERRASGRRRSASGTVSRHRGGRERRRGTTLALTVGSTRLPPEWVRPRVVRRRRLRSTDRCAEATTGGGLRRPPQFENGSRAARGGGRGRCLPRPDRAEGSAFEPDRFLSTRWIAQRDVSGREQFEDLPGYLAAMDVGLVPYGATEFNRWSFPMKTLEYLAAGLPVVSTSLPAVRWLDTALISLAGHTG